MQRCIWFFTSEGGLVCRAKVKRLHTPGGVMANVVKGRKSKERFPHPGDWHTRSEPLRNAASSAAALSKGPLRVGKRGSKKV